MSNTIDHSNLVLAILLMCGTRYPKTVRMWKNATGTAKSFDGKRVIKYGLVGSADLTGILSDGRRCDIEVKTGNAVQSPAQKNYQKMIEEMDGVYILARSTDDVIRVLDAKIIK